MLLTSLNTIITKFAIPTLTISVAIIAHEKHWGVFNFFTMPLFLEILLCIILFDLIIYAQHYIFHHIPLLWRIHRVHHTDVEFDVSTSLRFHPVEIILSLIVKSGAVLVLGASLEAIILFEVILNVMAMFNHSNIKLPLKLENVLRMILVTPDMHRVHHSIRECEQASNFGFNLSIWDKLFATYKSKPLNGHILMEIGVLKFKQLHRLNFIALLSQPFQKALDE